MEPKWPPAGTQVESWGFQGHPRAPGFPQRCRGDPQGSIREPTGTIFGQILMRKRTHFVANGA